jgi:hypothetical protein
LDVHRHGLIRHIIIGKALGPPLHDTFAGEMARNGVNNTEKRGKNIIAQKPTL